MASFYWFIAHQLDKLLHVLLLMAHQRAFACEAQQAVDRRAGAAVNGAHPANSKLQSAGKFHDENGVLGREPHQYDEPYLGEEFVPAKKSQITAMAESRPMGTMGKVANGRVRL